MSNDDNSKQDAMIRHYDVQLTSRTLCAKEILSVSLRFAKAAEWWEHHPNSLQSSTLIGFHCMVICRREPVAYVALVTDHKNPRAVNITNIVPKNFDSLSMEEYNRIAKQFVSDFRRFARQERLDIIIKLKEFQLSLETAIPSPRCRELFEGYLQGFPRTFHPSDTYHLDTFICALVRFHGRVDLDALFAHLVNQLQWSPNEANIVCTRIRIGEDVLRANQHF